MQPSSLLKKSTVLLALVGAAMIGFAAPATAAPVVASQRVAPAALSLPKTPAIVSVAYASAAKKTVVLRWNRVSQAVDYELVVDNRFYMGLGTSTTLKLSSGAHFVQVRATNAAGASPWTKAKTFQTAPKVVSSKAGILLR